MSKIINAIRAYPLTSFLVAFIGTLAWGLIKLAAMLPNA